MKIDKPTELADGKLSAALPKQAMRPMHIVCGLGGAERVDCYLYRVNVSVPDQGLSAIHNKGGQR